MARHQRALSAGVGPARRGDLLASLRSWSSVGHSLPGLNLPPTATRRRRPVTVPRCGRHHGVHLENKVQNWVRSVRVLPPLQPPRQPESALGLITNWVRGVQGSMLCGIVCWCDKQVHHGTRMQIQHESVHKKMGN